MKDGLVLNSNSTEILIESATKYGTLTLMEALALEKYN
jgi:hypothetical protein